MFDKVSRAKDYACIEVEGSRDQRYALIFRVLKWHDGSKILKGARQAYPVKCAQNDVTLLFFPDFSPATAIRRKAFGFEEDDSTWSPALPHLSGGN